MISNATRYYFYTGILILLLICGFALCYQQKYWVAIILFVPITAAIFLTDHYGKKLFEEIKNDDINA